MTQKLSTTMPGVSAHVVSVPVGAIISDYPFSTAPDGWIMRSGTNVVQSLGSASSGADLAGEIGKTLYCLYWEQWADASAPVSGGRGATAEADFEAHKTLTFPIDRRGRHPLIAGQGSSLTNRVLGVVGGAETHQMSVNEMPAHTHNLFLAYSGSSTYGLAYYPAPNGGTSAGHLAWMDPRGGDLAHNNMGPYYVTNVIQKL